MPMGKIYRAKRPVGRPRKAKKTNRKQPRKGEKAINHYGGSFPRTGVQTAGNPLPIRYSCKMKYTSVIQADQRTTSLFDHTYVLNGLFKPSLTGSTHQPIGYDELENFYRNYKVYGADVEVVACLKNLPIDTASTRNSNSFVLGLWPTAGSVGQSPPTTFGKLIEKKGVKWCLSSFEKPCRIKCYYDIASMFGLTKAQYKNERSYASGVGANPGDTGGGEEFRASLTPYVLNTDPNATTICDFTYIITIIYYATFWSSEYLVRSVP